VVSKETGLEENADKPKYVVMSGGAGRSDNIKIEISSFEIV
jgi:hypothetical protein